MPAVAALLLCAVVGVTDGDTLTARCDGAGTLKVRLAEIDASEHWQAFGERSKQALGGPVLRPAGRGAAYRRQWWPRPLRPHGGTRPLQRDRCQC